MAYHTVPYLFLFLPIVIIIYQLMPKNKRWCVLLLAGYIFFWLFSRKLVLFLVGTTLFTHYIGTWLMWKKEQGREQSKNCEREESKKIKKEFKRKEQFILAFGIVGVLAVLAYLKYYNFFAENINPLLTKTGLFTLTTKDMLLPIGISFYTLQAIGYMVDVYWEKINEEQPLPKVALFLGFFPQIMEGPISLYSQTADSLWEGKPITFKNLTDGCVRILWGLFKKIVIADRLYMLVKTLFDNYQEYSGVMIIVAAVAYTTQLYMEFSGCMDIVIGSGQIFGIKLPENFNHPFISRNASEFWKRWHITLGVWFKTYIFYPVSVSKIVRKWNRFGKKHLGKYLTKLGISAICLFPVWLCNGVWHGARWSYIFYGMYYFIILLAGLAVAPVREKLIKICHIDENAFYWKIPAILKTWVIIFTGELFFRAEGFRVGLSMFLSVFRDFQIQKLWDGSLLLLGLDKADFAVICAGVLIVAIVGFIQERKLLGEEGLCKLKLPVRWILYYGLIISVVILGAYGTGYQQVDLIYAGF